MVLVETSLVFGSGHSYLVAQASNMREKLENPYGGHDTSVIAGLLLGRGDGLRPALGGLARLGTEAAI